jgi:UDP:flavonoid glycosyltransferase YjiC (YdhE family)
VTPRRFLVITWEGGGNVPPAIALGQRLVLAGHRVTVLGGPSSSTMAAEAGLGFEGYKSVPRLPANETFDDNGDLFQEVLSGDGVARDIIDLAAREHPDALVVDCMMGAAHAAAERLAVPAAVLVHVLYRPFVDQWGQFVLDDARPRVALGLSPREALPPADVLARADVVLALVPPGFDFDGPPLPTNTHYVGPILTPEAAHASPWGSSLSGQNVPLVLVSFSTTLQGQRDALPPVLSALGALPVRGLLTLGGVLHPGEVAAPANVEVVSYLPHGAVLPSAAAVICHGGLSTIMASLSYGVPLVCIPQGREQPLNAERVQACGVGEVLPAGAAAEQIAEALRSVLADPRYRIATMTAAEQIRECGNQAADLVEALVG